ncbi:MAG: aspartate--tRNA ligase [bacterium]|nr:aspartate--tRNA ligase [bacterium]
MERTLVKDIGEHEGEEVVLMGWVAVRRDHGKIIFIDLRDRSGIAQCVFIAKNTEVYALAETLRPEWVIKLTGTVSKRPDSMVNADLANGAWEVKVTAIEILNQAETPPIAIDTDGYDIGEEHRLKYRYLDLRRERLQANLRLRHEVIAHMRDYLNDRDFVEVETPIISKSTPEGARDYLVPSRVYPGKSYALPQSPQQYKQLLMTAGLERYYQFARCFRDEDTRGDRQPEFTQLDLEMSFVKQEDVMNLIESLYIDTVTALMPEKKIQAIPFPRLSYKEAMEKYGSDKPDIREDKNDPNLLAFCWVIDFPFFEKTEEKGKEWTFTHNPFSAPKPEHHGELMAEKNIGGIIAAQYDLALNGYEIGGGGIRNHTPEALRKVFKIIGYNETQIEENFGHMLHALASGTPPHGGIAMGIDRLLAILANEPNIREVIAFPKTGDARDLMMDAPSPLAKNQLEEVGLELKKPNAQDKP